MSDSREEVELKEFGAKVPKKEYEFFRTTFPQYGATNWFINAALVKFNEEVKKNPSLADQVDNAVKEMLKENRGG